MVDHPDPAVQRILSDIAGWGQRPSNDMLGNAAGFVTATFS